MQKNQKNNPNEISFESNLDLSALKKDKAVIYALKVLALCPAHKIDFDALAGLITKKDASIIIRTTIFVLKFFSQVFKKYSDSLFIKNEAHLLEILEYFIELGYLKKVSSSPLQYQMSPALQEKIVETYPIDYNFYFTSIIILNSKITNIDSFPIEKANNFLLFAQSFLEKIKDNNNQLFFLSSNLANYYRDNKNYNLAIQYYLQALDLFEKAEHEDDDTLLELNFEIGHIYKIKKDANNTLKYYTQTLTLLEDMRNDTQKEALLDYKKLVVTSIEIGTCYHEKKDYTNAIIHYEKGLEVLNKSIDVPNVYIASIYQNLGYAHKALGSKAKALQNFEQFLYLSIGESMQNEEDKIYFLKNIENLKQKLYNESNVDFFERK